MDAPKEAITVARAARALVCDFQPRGGSRDGRHLFAFRGKLCRCANELNELMAAGFVVHGVPHAVLLCNTIRGENK